MTSTILFARWAWWMATPMLAACPGRAGRDGGGVADASVVTMDAGDADAAAGADAANDAPPWYADARVDAQGLPWASGTIQFQETSGGPYLDTPLAAGSCHDNCRTVIVGGAPAVPQALCVLNGYVYLSFQGSVFRSLLTAPRTVSLISGFGSNAAVAANCTETGLVGEIHTFPTHRENWSGALYYLDPTTLVGTVFWSAQSRYDPTGGTTPQYGPGGVTASDSLLAFVYGPAGDVANLYMVHPLGAEPDHTSFAMGATFLVSGHRLLLSDYYAQVVDYENPSFNTGVSGSIIPDSMNAWLDGDHVVWADVGGLDPATASLPPAQQRHFPAGIYVFDIPTRARRALITTPVTTRLRPTASGDWIVWEDYRNVVPGAHYPTATGSSGVEIWGYNLRTNREYQLVTNMDVQVSRVVGNKVYFGSSARIADGSGWFPVVNEVTLPVP